MTKRVGSIPNFVEQVDEQHDCEAKSKFRSLAAQCCGVLAANCLKFTSNTFNGFHIILIAELHKEKSEITTTLNQLTWIASLNFMVPIGSLVNGFVAQRMGNRIVMLWASVAFTVCWLLYYFATSATMLMGTGVMYSLLNGALRMPTSTYITEISQPQLRGSFLATSHLAATLGMFFSLLLGSMLYWRTVALINLTFPVLSFFLVLSIPDSPVWLVGKGRFVEAEAALCWLRGWVNPIDVRSEFLSLIENLQKSLQSSANYSSSDDKSSFLKPFMHRSFYLPFGSISLVYIIHYLSGLSAIHTYSMLIFQEMHSPINESVATAVMGAMRVMGACIILSSIQRTGKRKLMFVSLVVAFGCYLAIGLVGFLMQLRLLSSPTYLWVSPIAMLIAVFANAAGVEAIVHMLNCELFPASTRYIGSAIGISVSSIAQSSMSKAFLYLVEAITLPGVFLFFGFMCLVAMVTYYFIVPETEGRTLREIEDHYGGGKRLSQKWKPWALAGKDEEACTQRLINDHI